MEAVCGPPPSKAFVFRDVYGDLRVPAPTARMRRLIRRLARGGLFNFFRVTYSVAIRETATFHDSAPGMMAHSHGGIPWGCCRVSVLSWLSQASRITGTMSIPFALIRWRDAGQRFVPGVAPCLVLFVIALVSFSP